MDKATKRNMKKCSSILNTPNKACIKIPPDFFLSGWLRQVHEIGNAKQLGDSE